jgi:GMP synthase (glutamine-hydrolysing)
VRTPRLAVLVIRHESHEGPGLIGERLVSRGFRLELLDAWRETLPEDPAFYAAIVVMGGSMGVYEQDRFPFLSREIALMSEARRHGVPVLGVCLGSQLLAAAAGAKVYPGGKKEIGWRPVTLTESARKDEIFGGCPQEFMTFHWHGDTFDLPEGAERLASSGITVNQAFRWGASAWGIQFHPEVTPAMIREWVRHGMKTGEIAAADSKEILELIPSQWEASAALGRALFDRFARFLSSFRRDQLLDRTNLFLD